MQLYTHSRGVQCCGQRMQQQLQRHVRMQQHAAGRPHGHIGHKVQHSRARAHSRRAAA
jgi:hypothetical protein